MYPDGRVPELNILVREGEGAGGGKGIVAS